MSEPKHPVPVTPAIHTDELWDKNKLEGGMLTNLGPTPVKIDTKTEFMRELNKRGLRMKNQQESVTGPELAPEPEKIKELPVAPSLNEGHVRSIRAFSRVLDRYNVKESLWCDVCWELGAPSGVRVTWTRDGQGCCLRCNCATRKYTCTTDVSYTRADALTLNDHTDGVLYGADGNKIVPTTLIQNDDAKLILRYLETLRALKLNNSILCFECKEACEVKFQLDEIVMACQCHIRYWKGTTH